MNTGPIGRRAACRYLLGAAAAGTLALAGCGGKRPMGGGYTADGRPIVTYWNGFTGPDGTTMEHIVSQFQRENPDVVVRMQIIPWATYYDKLTLALAYGGAPDVFVMQVMYLPMYATYAALRPLADRYAADDPPLTAADFAPAAWQRSFYQGVQYGLPLDVFLCGLYYNTQLFREAGIVDANGRARPPETWDEFLEAAHRLTPKPDASGRQAQWGFAIQDLNINWNTFAYQHGADFLTPDGTHGAMRSPAALAATGQMHDLIYRYRVAPRPAGTDAWLAFRQGKVGMEVAGLFMLHSLLEQNGLQFAGAPVPQFGPMRATWAGTNILCQPRGLSEDHSRAAWRLMRHLSDHNVTWASAGMVPARTAARRAPEFAAMPVQYQFARQVPYLHYEPLSPHYTGVIQFTVPAIESVLLDLEPAARAMGDADRRIDQVLRRE